MTQAELAAHSSRSQVAVEAQTAMGNELSSLREKHDSVVIDMTSARREADQLRSALTQVGEIAILLT